jgi:hypothetical protein
MSDQLLTSLVTVATAIIGVAILAVLVSRNAQTPQVLQAAGQSFSGALGAALAPITGSSVTGGSTFTGYPTYGAYTGQGMIP